MEITNYYDRFQHQFECVDPELISEIQKSFLVPRITKTDLEPFREKFGHELPDDIKDYINLYWHPYIYGAYDCYKQKEDSDGYYKFDEGLVLFSVMKHKGKTDDDVLFQKYGVYDLTAELYDDLAERAEEAPISPDIVNEVKKYICIGWTEYAAHRVLYKIATGEIYLESWREDRVADDKPIAGSLSELINKIYFLNPGR
ncbi:MAG: hypothetical protein IJ806_09860 [Ruminococcus sp.]|nr:hypothetical protein [Ruminococcus sp.]